jgi:sugar lactone lactonase YvrE
MSDYITGLRADLVEAAARHQHRGSLARRALPVLPRAWSRPALAAVAVTAACVAAVVIAVSAIGPSVPRPTRRHVAVSAKIADSVFDAVLSGGALWVTDFNEGVVRVDPASGRVLDRIALAKSATTIGAGQRRLWALIDGTTGASMAQIDPRSGRVIARHGVAQASPFGVFTVDAGGLWLPASPPAIAMMRVPAPGRAPTALLRLGTDEYVVGAVATPGTLWVVTDHGMLVEADNLSGRIVESLPHAVTGSHGNGANEFPVNGLAADADGVWAVDQDRAVVVRFSSGHIVQRIRTGGYPEAIALARGSLWVAVADTARRRYRVVRFDPSSGRSTGSADVGYHVPKALVPSSHGLWVVASDGTALLVR